MPAELLTTHQVVTRECSILISASSSRQAIIRKAVLTSLFLAFTMARDEKTHKDEENHRLARARTHTHTHTHTHSLSRTKTQKHRRAHTHTNNYTLTHLHLLYLSLSLSLLRLHLPLHLHTHTITQTDRQTGQARTGQTECSPVPPPAP